MFCVDQRVKLSGGWIEGLTPGWGQSGVEIMECLALMFPLSGLRRSIASNRAVKELSRSFTVPGKVPRVFSW